MEVTPIDVAVLGPLRIRLRGHHVDLGDRARRLLLALLARRGAIVGPQVLIDAIWPEDPPNDPRNALQAQVSRLRRALGPAAHHLVTEHGGYRLDLPPDAVDADRLRTAVTRARLCLEVEDPDERAAARTRLAAALDAWAGEPFLEATDDPEAAAERAGLHDLRLEAAERLVEITFADAGNATGVADALDATSGLIARLRPLAEEQPLREPLHRALATALARAGRHREALDVLGRLQRRLRDDGLDPDPATDRLQRAILNHEPVGVPGTAQVRDPGRTRHLDVPALPSPTTSFIGRHREVAEVLHHLRSARAITLTGPGGTGKTRLALEVAHRWVNQEGGRATFVELASLTTDADVLPQVAAAVGVPAGHLPTSGTNLPARRPLADRLASHLAEQELVLVLDNGEHVIDGAAEVVDLLLSTAPNVRVLTTSREPLRVPGEIHVAVPPLGIDDGAGAGGLGGEAVKLFLERARAAAPQHPLGDADLTTVTELCRRLDGLPLAIELAAARIATLPLPALVERLGDRFELLTGGRRTVERQRTLRAVVAWSYDLLDEPQQRLLRRLGVFAGSPSVGLVEEVCADDALPEAAILPTLTDLADRSLLQLTATPHGDTRVRMLETIRDFARLHLAEHDVEVVRDRHARAMAERASQAGRGLQRHEQLRWLERLDAEHDDLRAAIEHLLDHEPTRALGMTCDLAWYWWLRRISEGRSWLERALGASDAHEMAVPVASAWLAFLRAFDQCGEDAVRAAAEDAEVALDRVGAALDPARTATVRGLVAYVHLMVGDAPAQVAQRLDEALTLARSAGDAWVEAATHFSVAVAAAGRGASDVAMRHAREVLRICEESGDRWARFQTLQVTASIHARRGDYDTARGALASAAEVAAEMGITDQVWILRSQHALVTMLAGDLRAAEEQLTAVLDDAARDGQRIPFALHGLGLVAHRAGDEEAAIAWHQKAADRLGALGERHATAEALAGIAFAHAARERWEAAAEAVASALSHLPPEPLTTTHPLLLEAAAAAVEVNDPTLALRRLGRAAALREELGGVIVGGDRFDVDRVEARARQGLHGAHADTALQEGRSADGLLPPIA
jgi:predicted ATPase/DNA-binding SARP family transcriptional activator